MWLFFALLALHILTWWPWALIACSRCVLLFPSSFGLCVTQWLEQQLFVLTVSISVCAGLITFGVTHTIRNPQCLGSWIFRKWTQHASDFLVTKSFSINFVFSLFQQWKSLIGLAVCTSGPRWVVPGHRTSFNPGWSVMGDLGGLWQSAHNLWPSGHILPYKQFYQGGSYQTPAVELALAQIDHSPIGDWVAITFPGGWPQFCFQHKHHQHRWVTASADLWDRDRPSMRPGWRTQAQVAVNSTCDVLMWLMIHLIHFLKCRVLRL